MMAYVRGKSLAGLVALGFVLAVLAGCGEKEDTQADTAIHDTGSELLGEPNTVVAEVDGEPITFAEVNLVTRFWIDSRAQRRQAPVERNELQRQALDHLIDQRALAQESIGRGYEVAESSLDSMVTVWEGGFPNPDDRDDRLRESGVTLNEVRESFRRDRLVQILIAKVIDDTLQVAEEEVQAYYAANPQFFDTTRVRVSHVLLTSQPGEPAARRDSIRARAAELHGDLKGGADFASTARAQSDCPSSANGGDLGYANRNRQSWVAPFHAAAFALKEGEISDVVETQFGYHILKVTERDDGGLDFASVEPNIRQFLRGNVMQEAVNRLAQELRSSKDVKVNLQ